jgi:hypothetical protein
MEKIGGGGNRRARLAAPRASTCRALQCREGTAVYEVSNIGSEGYSAVPPNIDSFLAASNLP